MTSIFFSCGKYGFFLLQIDGTGIIWMSKNAGIKSARGNVMSELQIAWLELITVGGLGAILILTGILLNIVLKKRCDLCTDKTGGTVVRYGFPGAGRMYPILEYTVAGKQYQARKKFRGEKIKRISGLPVPVQSKAHEDEKGWLHVEIGPVANLRQLAEQLWPIGSKMAVYYDPNDPQKCYVDRPISKSFTSTMFLWMGLATILLSVLVFFLMQV